MIRMKLDGIREIVQLDFDLENRMLEVVLSDENPEIDSRLESLNLGAQLRTSEEIRDFAKTESLVKQKKLLRRVLLINVAFFVIEMFTGLISNSMGLVADSLDMLADAVVYGLSLWAVGAHLQRKKRVANISGYFQIFLAILGFVEVIRRFVFSETIPDYRMMIMISFFAMIANAASMLILQKTRSKEAHIVASKIFTSNDVIINAGVIIAGFAVMMTHSLLPDLIVGSLVFLVVIRGAGRILEIAK